MLLLAGGVLIGRRYRLLERGPYAWRMIALAAIALFFVYATYTIMGPVRGAAMAVFPVLIVGALHTAIGLWAGLRYVITGVVVLAAALGGYFFLQAHLLLWMAFVGGGSMILAGLWFRTV